MNAVRMCDERGIAATREDKVGKYLIFMLGQERFGFAILRFVDILGLEDILHVPQIPDVIRAVADFHGTDLPIMDLRLRFGQEVVDDAERHYVIVVEAEWCRRKILIGVVVDRFAEIRDIGNEEIRRPTMLRESGNTTLIQGFVRLGRRTVKLLDLDKVTPSVNLAEAELGMHAGSRRGAMMEA